MLRFLAVLAALFMTGPVFAGSVDANINDNSVSVNLAWIRNNKTPDALQVQAGYLQNTQGNRVLGAGVFVIGETGNSDNPMELGVGFKALGIQSANPATDTVYGLALGVELRYYPESINRLAFSSQIYYGPNVVVSSPASSITELGLRAEYQILPQAFAYFGYRSFNVALSGGGNDLIDNGFHLGVRIMFE